MDPHSPEEMAAEGMWSHYATSTPYQGYEMVDPSLLPPESPAMGYLQSPMIEGSPVMGKYSFQKSTGRGRGECTPQEDQRRMAEAEMDDSLSKNALAARKHRHRRKEANRKLESEAERLLAMNQDLHTQVAGMRQEIEILRQAAQIHQSNACLHTHDWPSPTTSDSLSSLSSGQPTPSGYEAYYVQMPPPMQQ